MRRSTPVEQLTEEFRNAMRIQVDRGYFRVIERDGQEWYTHTAAGRVRHYELYGQLLPEDHNG